MSISITKSQARRIWLRAQRLDTPVPFGAGHDATKAAVEHLGYVQIDTINVIERCHHHILYSRIPDYRRADLQQAQAVDKSVFEYWTHALSYVPTRDIRFFLPAMKRYMLSPGNWFASVDPADLRKMLKRIEADGPLSIRDVDDDVLVEKDHAWASRKPSKRVLQLGFYTGALTVSERIGMLKAYDLTDRHFGWEARPRPATDNQITAYLLDRALRSQGIISLDSACHLDAKRKPLVRQAIDAMVKRKQLRPVHLEGHEGVAHWATPETLETPLPPSGQVHILSPFDPVTIQRKRLKLFFDYDHIFEAYVPAAKRVMGYFALPILLGDRIVAAVDLKTDRAAQKLLVQKWTWLVEPTAEERAAVDEALGRFERFQLES
jgi:uncharacterized protein YcaQ